MSELPPDLDRLRTLETYLRLQLDAVRTALARAERAEQDAVRQAEAAEQRRRILAGWTIERQWQRRVVHHGECLQRDDHKCQGVTYAQAREAVDSRDATACAACGAQVRLDAPA